MLLGVLLISMLFFSAETIAPSVSAETLLYVRGFVDVVTLCNLGIGFLLIISSSIRDLHSARKVLLGELVLMSFLLIVDVLNTLNAVILVDGRHPHLFGLLLSQIILCVHID